MNEKELKEAVEKSDMETEAKEELIEIVAIQEEIHEQELKTIDKIFDIAVRWSTTEIPSLIAMDNIWGLFGYPTKLKEKEGVKQNGN